MTTQELKEYINKVLGNTIRCLLPSYWWKRLFGIVVDKIDEVELNAGKTIETSLKDFEKKYPTIASRTFYLTTDPDSDYAKSNIKLANSIYMELIMGVQSEKSVDISPVYLAVPLIESDDLQLTCVQAPQYYSLDTTTFYNVIMSDAKAYDIKIARDGTYTKTIGSGGGASALTIYNGETSERNKTIYNKLYQEYNSNSSISSLIQVASGGYTYLADVIIRTYESGYVFKISAKGISEWSGYNRIYPQWTLKSTGQVSVQWMTDFSVKTIDNQSILGSGNINTKITVDTAMSSTSTNPVQNKVINSVLNNKQDKLNSGTNIKTINNQSILGSGNINIEGGSNITVDSVVSASSTNPVQNKVIKAYVDNAVQNVEIDVDSALSSSSTNPVQNKVVNTALGNKVDKVSGKQLSTEDFTTALKTKLEGLNAFDPSEINSAINGLQSQLNTLVNDNASSAIESFNEIIAFLNGITDTESLDGIIASIEQQLTLKQNTLVSGTNIKTVNGESILGSGNIVVDVADEVYVGSTPPTDENVTVWIDLDASIGDVDWNGIVVDEELSPNSTNPIQNKTVYALAARLDGIEAILDNING